MMLIGLQWQRFPRGGDCMIGLYCILLLIAAARLYCMLMHACYSDEFGQDGTMIESSTVSAVDGTIHRMRPVAPLLHHSDGLRCYITYRRRN
jgi:hypothetical protein